MTRLLLWTKARWPYTTPGLADEHGPRLTRPILETEPHGLTVSRVSRRDWSPEPFMTVKRSATGSASTSKASET